jgi:aminoglycoside 6'-N-acetyltransferase
VATILCQTAPPKDRCADARMGAASTALLHDCDVVVLRAFSKADLPFVASWLRQPHVVRWWPPEMTPEAEIEKYLRRIVGEQPATMLMVIDDGRPIGWCQWYRWVDFPAEAEATGAEPGEVGIDYAVGDPSAVGRGVGTELIRVLLDTIYKTMGRVGVRVAPEAANKASRRVLERNGFELVAVRPIATEWTAAPMAIYRSRPDAEE